LRTEGLGVMAARSVLLVGGKCGAGMRARRRGNFLLRGQKKVTKEEALNRTPSRRRDERRAKATRVMPHRREPLRSRPLLVPSTTDTNFTSLKSRLHADARESKYRTAAPLGRRWTGFSGEHGVQPRVGRGAGAMDGARDKSDARAKRVASSHDAAACSRARRMATPRSCAVQRLFFGDFLLAPQKKVTRPPGRTPGNLPADPSHR
jgi:hypothetical protein